MTRDGSPMLAVRAASVAYGARRVLFEVSLEVAPGEVVAIVGPNGAGKSTLLRAAVGALPLAGGTIALSGAELESLTRREVARRAAFLPQSAPLEFEFSVREVVAMGRTPHLGRFRPLGADDRRAIDDALGATRVAEMAERSVVELSGGERQRVMLARAIAQAAPLLVLDEPSASLDLLHAFELLELLERHARGGGAVLVALHDLGAAARFADRVVVLDRGRLHSSGPARDVLSRTMMREVFGVDARLLEDDGHVTIAVRGRAEAEGS